MDCANVRSGFSGGALPSGAEVERHLAECAACRALFEGDARLGVLLAQASERETSSSALRFAQVAARLNEDTGFRASLREASTPTRVLLTAAACASVALATFVLKPRQSWPTGDTLGVAGLLAAIFGGAIVCVRLALQPLWKARRTTRDAAVALAALALPFALAAVSPFGASLASGAHSPRAVACYTFGAALSLPILLLVRLLDRNERSPLLPLALTAAATGLIANLVLSLHCASDDPVHLALGHASIGVGWLLAVVLRERFRSRSSASSR